MIVSSYSYSYDSFRPVSSGLWISVDFYLKGSSDFLKCWTPVFLLDRQQACFDRLLSRSVGYSERHDPSWASSWPLVLGDYYRHFSSRLATFHFLPYLTDFYLYSSREDRAFSKTTCFSYWNSAQLSSHRSHFLHPALFYHPITYSLIWC